MPPHLLWHSFPGSNTHRGGDNGRFYAPMQVTLAFCAFLFLTACTAPGDPPPVACGDNGLIIAPTATRPRDPDLSSPPGPPPPDDGASYCPTPAGAATAPVTQPEGFVATEVVNLSLDLAGQEVQAVAVGDDMMAVGWVDDGHVYVALARGGNHFQVRAVDEGSRVALVFSPANREHRANAPANGPGP